MEVKLIWRPKPHTPRRVVGTLRQREGSYTFVYDGPDLLTADTEGFGGYPGLANRVDLYNGQAMTSFASRLPGRDRPDFGSLVAAWGGDADMSDFELLGLTCGRLPTDMFEFIPVIEPERGAVFQTDLAGIENYAAAQNFRELAAGSELELKPNPANEFDADAVQVLHQGHQVAHIKRVHSSSVAAAIRAGLQVHCQLVRVRMNGSIREVIVRIRYD